ncbi:MAG: hypothetical protein WA160_14800 [Pseudobdellovibrio sp.]
MRSLYLVGILIVFNSVVASAITCSNANSGETYELVFKGNINTDNFGVYKFDNNALIDLTVTKDDGIEKYRGNIVVQNYGAVTKRGRMAYYVFNVKNTQPALFMKSELAFVVSILGIDVFGDDRILCAWL